MMPDLKLYQFRVFQEWFSEASGYVWAYDEKDAQKVPEWEIRLHPEDDVFSRKEFVLKEISLSFFLDEKVLGSLFFAPHKIHGDSREVNFDDFMEFFNPEELKRQRVYELEKNNGQLPLFE